MKLREVIRAISGFQYEVNEYDTFPTKAPSFRTIEIKIDDTNIRCLQHHMHHEVLIGGLWKIIDPDQFQDFLKSYQPKAIKRTSQGVSKIDPKKQSVVDRLRVTDHALERIKERFDVEPEQVKPFLKDFLEDHIIVQNAELYNTIREHKPNDFVVWSVKRKAILIMTYERRQYVIKTAYSSFESRWFQNWFDDNLNIVHEMPTIFTWFDSCG